LLVNFNDTIASYPKQKTIIDLFEEKALQVPDSMALLFEDKQLSYKQLNEKANQLAHYLRSKGVKEETLVPICIERSLEMIIGILGILKAGGAYVPIDPEYPEERISYMLKDTNAAIVVSSKESWSKLQTPEGVEVVELDTDWRTINMQSTENLQVHIQPHHLAYLIYTSGSTGKPKGVMIEHGSVVNLITTQSVFFNITADERILQFSNYTFDASVEQIFLSLFNGASLILFTEGLQLDKNLFESFLNDKSISHLHATPSFLENVTPYNYKCLKRVIAGGDLCKKELAEKWNSTLTFYNEYGPTETTVTAIEYQTHPTNNKEKIASLPIGKPLSNTQVYILNNAGTLCPVGVFGVIHIGGVQVARGYLNMPQLTTAKFIKNPFSTIEDSRLYCTGDLGRWLADGNIEYLGRIDNQVKINGYRIELEEIESILQQSDLVSQAAVLARNDANGHKRLIGYVVPNGIFNKEAIITNLKSRLPHYIIPALWVELAELPLTSNGKIDRNSLPDPEMDLLSKKEYEAPLNEVEEKLAIIWQDLLGIKKVGIHDNFFELGGHSLLAMKMVSVIERNLLLSIPISALFQFTTISDLSKYIEIQSIGFSKNTNTSAFELIDI
jgi:amino acid adenylation domain-containing protein